MPKPDLIGFSIFRSIESGKVNSRNLTVSRFDFFYVTKVKIIDPPSAAYFVYKSAFGRISLMRDDGDDNSKKRGREDEKQRNGEIKTRSIKSIWNE